MAEQFEPQSPMWWLDRLGRQLLKRGELIRKYEAYYAGDHTQRFMTDRFREAFGGLFRNFSDNWCELVVDACEERLKVEGFRFGDDPKADVDAWQLWQANYLDADSKIGHTEALKNGIDYTWIEPGEPPTITVEHPLFVTHETQPGNRRKVAAALKMWQDDAEHLHAVVRTPDETYTWRSDRPVKDTDKQWRTLMKYLGDDPETETNQFGRVLVVPLVNRPGLLYPNGRSELANVIPTQDAVNKLVVDMMVASNFGAFVQKWATGIEIPVDPDTGEEIEAFKAAVDKLWHTKASDAKFGQFDPTDLTNYVKAIETMVQHIASQTRTPPHYFYLRGEFPSGESLKSAETGLVAKVRDRQVHFGEAWEETIRLAFLVQGDRRADEMMAETIWGDPETRSEAEAVDAAMKRQAIGIPPQQLWEDLGYSPQQISRFQAMHASDQLIQSVGTGTVSVEEQVELPVQAS